MSHSVLRADWRTLTILSLLPARWLSGAHSTLAEQTWTLTRCRFPTLHSTAPCRKIRASPSANQLELWQRPSVMPFCLMKKYSFSPFKKAQDLLLAAHQWTITNHYSSKYQYTEADVQSQCVWGRKKGVALEMGFPNENATKTQHKPTCALEPLSSKTATKRWRTP